MVSSTDWMNTLIQLHSATAHMDFRT